MNEPLGPGDFNPPTKRVWAWCPDCRQTVPATDDYFGVVCRECGAECEEKPEEDR